MPRFTLFGVDPTRRVPVLDRMHRAIPEVTVMFMEGSGSAVRGTLDVSELECPKKVRETLKKIGPVVAEGVGPDPEIVIAAPGRPDVEPWTRGAFVGLAG